MRKRIIAVIGAADCSAETVQLAESVGELLAKAGCIVVTGGLGGVMRGASRGAQSAGGLVVGILPGNRIQEANGYVDVPIATGVGDARNAMIANTAEAFVAVSGSFGTLSEMAYALKRKKRVVSLGGPAVEGDVILVDTPQDAVRQVLAKD